jgi:hypothetical protein
MRPQQVNMRDNLQVPRGEAINRGVICDRGLVSSGTIPGARPSVQRLASTAPSPVGRMTADGCCRFASPDNQSLSAL